MSTTITIEVDRELAETFIAARDRRRNADDGSNKPASDEMRAALAAENDAAGWLALHVANQVENA